MSEVTTNGPDIAKDALDAYGPSERGNMLISRKLTRLKLLELFAGQP
ncbi:hypothetical protein SAMN06272759_1504 [Novosphingobium sp. B1]|nr:hypothetical protein SAMN06272759_1504 [Novosphingobium sp. B1]